MEETHQILQREFLNLEIYYERGIYQNRRELSTLPLPFLSLSLFSCHFTRVEFTPTIYADILRYRQPLNGINYNQNPPESLRINFLVTRTGEGEGGRIKREPLRGSEIINSARITTSNVLTGNGGRGV